jgi:hypothetical protein
VPTLGIFGKTVSTLEKTLSTLEKSIGTLEKTVSTFGGEGLSLSNNGPLLLAH